MSVAIQSCFLIVGPSGIGKGYGVGRVMEEFHATEGFVTGDWCRDNAPELAKKGVLVDDECLIQAAESRFEILLSQHSDGVRLYIDMPRSIEQVHEYIRIFRQLGYRGDVNTLLLNVPDVKTSIDRLLERAMRQSRQDDRCPITINRRVSTWYGTPLKQVTAGEIDYSGVLDRNEDGLAHTLVPFLRDNTNLYELDPTCLEELRSYVRYELPHIVRGW
jgi:adenylate kinase family enzyme